jgi:hypothetical protein
MSFIVVKTAIAVLTTTNDNDAGIHLVLVDKLMHTLVKALVALHASGRLGAAKPIAQLSH